MEKNLPRLRMMRMMTKRIMNEEMMSNPMRMKVTMKMATETQFEVSNMLTHTYNVPCQELNSLFG